MAFADRLTTLPVHAAQADAQGFLPPLIRAQGHLMLVLVQVADENATPNEDELLTELTDARNHWEDINGGDAISTGTTEVLNAYRQALSDATTEWPDWDRDTRVKNLRDLASRAASIAVVLDRELVGLTTSDAGYNL